MPNVDKKPDTVPKKLRRRTTAQSFAYAKAHGWLAEIIPSNVLFLDIDSSEGKAQFAKMFSSLQRQLEVDKVRTTKSKSGNTHVRIWVGKELDLFERIAWQAILGSDPRKEASSMLGVYYRDPTPILAFEIDESTLCTSVDANDAS